MRAAPALAFLLCLISPAAAKAEGGKGGREEGKTGTAISTSDPWRSTPPETYRLRVMNTLYGEVEASTDGGETWLLVARVLKPAVERVPGGMAESATVEKSSHHGMAFGVGDKKLVRMLPDSPANHRDPAAIVVNQTPAGSLFKDLLPTAGSSVQQVTNRKPSALPPGYLPQENDQLLFIVYRVNRTDISPPKMADYVKEASQRYQDGAIAKVRASGKKPAGGFLTINATPAKGDSPGAITFVLDGAVVGILNRAPYSLRLDTRSWTNGEHLVEVRGLNDNGASYTQKKVLVVVDNRP